MTNITVDIIGDDTTIKLKKIHLYAFEVPFQQNCNPACRGCGCSISQVRLKLKLGNVVFIYTSLTNLVALTCNQQD